MTAPFAPPRLAVVIHARQCPCTTCRRADRMRRDPRARRVRAIMMTIAVLIAAPLAVFLTPQAVATAVTTAL